MEEACSELKFRDGTRISWHGVEPLARLLQSSPALLTQAQILSVQIFENPPNLAILELFQHVSASVRACARSWYITVVPDYFLDLAQSQITTKTKKSIANRKKIPKNLGKSAKSDGRPQGGPHCGF